VSSTRNGLRHPTRRASGQLLRQPASLPHKQPTGDDYTYISTDFNTLWTTLFGLTQLFPHFSIAWHLSTCLRYPFSYWLDRFQLFLVGNPDHFQFLLARYQRWRLKAFHLQNTTRFIAQTRRYFHGLTYTSFTSHRLNHFFASTQPGAVSTLQHHTTLLTFFAGTYLTPVIGIRTTYFLLLRNPVWLQIFLVSFVCSNSFSHLLGWKGSSGGGLSCTVQTKSVFLHFSLHMSGRKKREFF
jgi:hypothetical protein